MPIPIKKQLSEEILKKRMEIERTKMEAEQRRRKAVFNIIEKFVDPVDEATLLSSLDSLDKNSWKEVIEERFIGRICGWPICENEITVNKIQRYKLDKNKQKVYENYAEHEKFCSPFCMQKSEHLQEQLAELPLWLTGERPPKTYHIIPNQNSAAASSTSKNAEKLEFVPDDLLVQLTSLNIGEINASDNEEDDEDIDTATLGVDDKQFLSNVHSFLSTKIQPSTKNANNTTSKASQDGIEKKKMDEETINSKLEKLRTKYGKCPKEMQKKAPIMVEPHRLVIPVDPKKSVVKNDKEEEKMETSDLK